ncbi:class I histocompatibility antigen, F10 alpha chain-like [Chelmon rostratus]|uniref:class I histocompatibility antigen, F10 alpha chain-like n=1 Tax=Chelmon rostratus TaxID=109905 RepID=UPI001BEC6FE2|nr:class I histocompatibility antigen, F10 alpha chain-like [Chelmon rostratus]
MRQFVVRTLVFLVLLGAGLHGAAAVARSLKYFYTASSGVPNLPEFVAVGMVNDVQIDHYDSNTRKNVPKQDSIRDTADDPDYWEGETKKRMNDQQVFKDNIEFLKQRFNQTGGVHIYQRMVGCEWDNETGVVNGYDQFGYDGEDFISFDLKTETYIAAKQQAVITKWKWENDKAWITNNKDYLTQICPKWLKKYVNDGNISLLRTELPSVSLLQKTPSSPVSCHASGFYPNRSSLVWRKDGEELHEGVELGEILPNHDGTFQMSADLKPSASEDWGKYECVFHLPGVKDVVTRLDKAVIRSNGESPVYIYIIVAVVVLALVLIAAVGFMIYKKKNAKRPPSPINNPEVLVELNPQA